MPPREQDSRFKIITFYKKEKEKKKNFLFYYILFFIFYFIIFYYLVLELLVHNVVPFLEPSAIMSFVEYYRIYLMMMPVAGVSENYLRAFDTFFTSTLVYINCLCCCICICILYSHH
jgi:hypothetical protein